jgi:hypothetical protein
MTTVREPLLEPVALRPTQITVGMAAPDRR